MQIEEKIGVLIQTCADAVSKDGLSEVKHFYDHGEYEMAFEGLVLELIKSDASPPNFDYDEWCMILKELKLDHEAVFDSELWPKFEAWGKSRAR